MGFKNKGWRTANEYKSIKVKSPVQQWIIPKNFSTNKNSLPYKNTKTPTMINGHLIPSACFLQKPVDLECCSKMRHRFWAFLDSQNFTDQSGGGRDPIFSNKQMYCYSGICSPF